MRYDLEERTLQFATRVILLSKGIDSHQLNSVKLQLIDSSTSIGANYAEANGAASKKDFVHKIYLCKKESKETLYWLRLVQSLHKNLGPELEFCLKEAEELVLIFSKIARSCK